MKFSSSLLSAYPCIKIQQLSFYRYIRQTFVTQVCPAMAVRSFATREITTTTKSEVSVEERRLKSREANEQRNVFASGLPSVSANKRKLSSDHQTTRSPSQADGDGRHFAPQRKRRKRFSKPFNQGPHTTPSEEEFRYYDEGDFDEVFDWAPCAGSSTPETATGLSVSAMHSQQTTANAMKGYGDTTLVSDFHVVKLITNIQNFTFNDSLKRPKPHNRPTKRKARAS